MGGSKAFREKQEKNSFWLPTPYNRRAKTRSRLWGEEYSEEYDTLRKVNKPWDKMTKAQKEAMLRDLVYTSWRDYDTVLVWDGKSTYVRVLGPNGYSSLHHTEKVLGRENRLVNKTLNGASQTNAERFGKGDAGAKKFFDSLSQEEINNMIKIVGDRYRKLSSE